jgi:hypothetical protein
MAITVKRLRNGNPIFVKAVLRNFHTLRRQIRCDEPKPRTLLPAEFSDGLAGGPDVRSLCEG